MGRRKIEMETVQDANTRQVTFSKRRTGLFKKASELATLCNAEVGIVVFSPGGKPFSFGKPSVEAVAERKKLEAEKSRGEELEKMLESAGDERFMKPMEELTLDELKEYKAKLEKMHDKLQSKATQMQASSCLVRMYRDYENSV